MSVNKLRTPKINTGSGPIKGQNSWGWSCRKAKTHAKCRVNCIPTQSILVITFRRLH